MTKFGFLFFCFLYIWVGSLPIIAQDEQLGRLIVEPYAFRTYDGKEHAAEIGKLWVRENRGVQSKRLIQLAFSSLTEFAYHPNYAKPRKYIKSVLSFPLAFKPGEGRNYSNTGFSLLAIIAENVSGESYEQYVREHLFKPAGMTETGYYIPRKLDVRQLTFIIRCEKVSICSRRAAAKR